MGSEPIAHQQFDESISWYAVGMEPSRTLWQVRAALGGKDGAFELHRLPGGRAESVLRKPMRAMEESSERPVQLRSRISFIPAVNKRAIGFFKLIPQGAVHPDASRSGSFNLGKYGISGRSRQDTFTVACAFSHRRVWASMLREGRPYAVVFEDDAMYALRGRSGSARGVAAGGRMPMQYVHGSDAVQAAIRAVSQADPNWEYINLGRCYDYCDAEHVVATVNETGQRVVTSPSSLCTHAYVVSANGARKLLSVTLPHLFAVDVLVTLLARNGLLRQYSLSPFTFTQRKMRPPAAVLLAARSSATVNGRAMLPYHIRTTALPECGAYRQGNISHLLQNATAAAEGERAALHAIGGHKLAGFSPVATDCPEGLRRSRAAPERGPSNHSTGASARSCTLHRLRCQLIAATKPWRSSPSNNATEFDEVHPDTEPLLRQMDALGLRGAIVWGLSNYPTHVYVHKAVHRALKYAFRRSTKPRHLCWIDAAGLADGCSLGRLLGHEGGTSSTAKPSSRLGRSLVFASPKHMGWTTDPALERLPIDPQSAYIFHDVMPPRFAPIVPLGRVVEWIVSGPDTSGSYLDSATFLARSSHLVEECGLWPPCTRDGSAQQPALFVAGWGTTLSPDDIAAAIVARRDHRPRRLPDTAYFLGSIRMAGARRTCEFAAGCRAVGTQIVRTGTAPVDPYASQCAQQTQPPLIRNEPRARLRDEDRWALMAESVFTPAVQDAEQLRSDEPTLSYIPDRALDSAALGKPIATNNRGVVALFEAAGAPDAVAYSTNLSALCAHGLRTAAALSSTTSAALQAYAWRSHTYVTRLRALLALLRPMSSADLADLDRSDSLANQRSTTSSGALSDKRWCAELAPFL